MPATRALSPDDLYRIQSLAEPQISSDGRRFAVLLIAPEPETDAYTYRVRLGDLETEQVMTVPIGHSTRIRSLRFSPDGTTLAWIQSDLGVQERVYALDIDEAFQRLQDSTAIAHIQTGSNEGVVESTGLYEVFKSKTLGSAVEWCPHSGVLYVPVLHIHRTDIRVYKRPHYKSDGVGPMEPVTSEVWKVQCLDNPRNPITSCLYEHPEAIAQFAVDPRGQTVAFTSDSRENEFYAHDIYSLELQSLTVSRILETRGPISALSFAPDGRYIGWVGHRGPRWNDTTQALWLTDVHTGSTRCMTQTFDRPIGPYGLGDVRPLQVSPQLCFDSTSKTMMFLASDHGVSSLYEFTPTDETPQRILDDDYPAVSYFSASTSGDVLFTSGKPTRPDALYHWRDGKTKLLFDPNHVLFDEIQVSEPSPFTFHARDDLSIEAWLMLPVSSGESHLSPCPLVLAIHGGPHNAFGYGFQMEFQTLCAAGFAVLYVNPRGSQTYGQTFASAVVDDWGGEDAQDLLQALDIVCDTGSVDSNRIGVTGYSYGGFMTNWLIAHSNRFRSAAAGGCVANLVSFHGTSDIGPVFGFEEHGTHVWDDPARLWQQSPIAFAKNVVTPLLLYHAETDDRCPIGQSEEFYTALSSLGRDVTFVRYSEGSHLFLTQGRPSFRNDKMNRVIDWFRKTLNKT